ncbi:MAG: alginate export family protein [Verrucomicrobiota bacterium]
MIKPGLTTSRPAIGWARYNEDWSVLKNESDLVGLDRIKYIPLDNEGDIYLSLGGQIRQRVEVWNNFAFAGSNDDVFLLSRYQTHADLHVTKYFRVFVEGIYSHVPDSRDLPGGTRAALDANEGDLLNAFVDFNFEAGDADITLRAGRQQFYFGKQRVISALPWANNYRKWDGFSGIFKYQDWSFTPLFAWNVPTDKFDFDDIAGTSDTGNGAAKLWGAYLSKKGLGDLYYFGRSRNGNADSHTIGVLRSAKIADTAFDYEIEGAVQLLDDNTNDDFAYMLGAFLGYTFQQVDTTPRIFTGVEMGSASYDQLFPLGHKYFGFTDVLGRGNTIDWNAGVSFTPVEKLKILAQHHMYFREDTDKGLTTVAGGAFRNNSSPTDNAFVGNELDVTASYPIYQNTSLLVGYSHFFAGDFIDDTGTADDIDFFYTQLLFRF